jgi:nucleoside-diphosphate-sugar epimerase
MTSGEQREAMPTVMVTGGAGFLGVNLLRHLRDRGYGLVSLDIAEFPYKDLHGRVRVVRGDIRNRGDVDKAMEGVQLVVHGAAALPLYSADDIRTTDVDGTRTVLESALAHGVQRVVHVSSTAVYGIPDHAPVREDDPLHSVGAYGAAKVEAERACLAFREKGLIVPILRPKSFVGPERLGVFALLYEWAAEGRGFPLLGSGRNRYQLLDVEDLCEAIHICLAGPPATVNDTFNIGAKEFGTIREDYQAVLDRAGHGKRIVTVPAAPAIIALRTLEKLGLSPIYKWVYETVAKDSIVATDKAERVLQFVPRFSNRDALLRNFDWYLQHKDTFADSSGVSHRVPWKQGALAILKRFF